METSSDSTTDAGGHRKIVAKVGGHATAKAKGKPKAKAKSKAKRMSKKSIVSLKVPAEEFAETHVDTSNESESSASPETRRIQAARQALVGTVDEDQECCTTSDSDDAAPVSTGRTLLPKSSGVFDYVEWIVHTRLEDTERATLSSKSPLVHGEMCVGMASVQFVGAALSRAMLSLGYSSFTFQEVFRCENDTKKLAFLKRHNPAGCKLFNSNSALADPDPVDVEGTQAPRPTCKTLSCGIVCKDISPLSTTPKSITDRAGKSGLAFHQLFQSLAAMRPQDRPAMLNLECVARLGEKRKVEAGLRTGTEYIDQELTKLGYVGAWRKVRPQNYYLPQSRPRVYSIHYKRNDFGPEAAKQRQADLDKAFALLLRMQTPVCEDLGTVLDRVMPKSMTKGRQTKRSRESQTEAAKQGRKWPRDHDAFAEEHGFTKADRNPPTDFESALGVGVPPRCVDAMWLKALLWSRRKNINWKEALLVLPVGFSIQYGNPRCHLFPCITPSHRYVVLRQGQGCLATGLTALAMQGIQNKEVVEATYGGQLLAEDDALLRDLAGNAFTANIMAAFFIAGVIFM